MGTANDWQRISAGWGYSLAIKTDGSLWVWGINNYGQLGDGTTTNQNVPTRIGTGNNWQKAVAGSFHTLAIQTTGSLWAWGRNDFGQLGDGTTAHKSVPTLISALYEWQTISGGVLYSTAIKNDGSLWTWGSNGDGELGDGTTVDKLVPTRIGTDNNWYSVSAGYGHVLGTRLNGTLWAWGRNADGAFGNGTTVNGNVPAPINCLSSILPVRLISFEGKQVDKSKVELIWKTASEINSDKYDIERSPDGLKFEKIGFVVSKNSISGAFYNFTDLNAGFDKIYYRLKAVDFDGSFEYSKIINLNIQANKTELITYPNPVENELNIGFSNELEGTLTVTNVFGKAVLSQAFSSTTKLKLDAGNFSDGIYFIEVRTNKHEHIVGKFSVDKK